jgi:hypothetical protein
VTESSGPSTGSPSGPLDERVVRTLTERSGHLAFNGLRRALDAHPESLTRSLRRLEREGMVGRDGLGYFLKGRPDAPSPMGASTRSYPLASVRLPFPIPPEAVLGVLAGRWFGPLRWVGVYDARRPPALVWAVPDVPGHLVLQVKGGRLKLTAEGEGLVGVPDALARASEELLWNVLGRLRTLAPAPPSHPALEPSGAVALAAGTSVPVRSGWAG